MAEFGEPAAEFGGVRSDCPYAACPLNIKPSRIANGTKFLKLFILSPCDRLDLGEPAFQLADAVRIGLGPHSPFIGLARCGPRIGRGIPTRAISDLQARREAAGRIATADDVHALDGPHRANRLDLPARRTAGAEDRQDARVRLRQKVNRQACDGAGAQGSQVGTLQQGDGRARSGIEERDEPGIADDVVEAPAGDLGGLGRGALWNVSLALEPR